MLFPFYSTRYLTFLTGKGGQPSYPRYDSYRIPSHSFSVTPLSFSRFFLPDVIVMYKTRSYIIRILLLASDAAVISLYNKPLFYIMVRMLSQNWFSKLSSNFVNSPKSNIISCFIDTVVFAFARMPTFHKFSFVEDSFSLFETLNKVS